MWSQSSKSPLNPPFNKGGVGGILALFLLSFLSITSIARNSQWIREADLWSDSTKKSPDDPRPYTNMAAALNRVYKYHEAIREYTKALGMNPDNHIALNGLGFAYFQLGRYDDAAAEYRKAIEAFDDPLYHDNLAMALEKSGNIREAVEEVSALIRRKPDDISLRAYLLTLLHKIGERESYLYGLAQKGERSRNPRDLLEAGWACTGLDRNSEAVEFLDRALDASPGQPAAHYFLGIALGRIGRNDEAIPHAERAMRDSLIFSAAESHYNLGILYQTMRNTRAAEKEYLLALEREPGNSQAHNNLGILYFSRGERDRALTEFHAAIKADPDNAEARKNLSRIGD